MIAGSVPPCEPPSQSGNPEAPQDGETGAECDAAGLIAEAEQIADQQWRQAQSQRRDPGVIVS
jgi:hypothetical protein